MLCNYPTESTVVLKLTVSCDSVHVEAIILVKPSTQFFGTSVTDDSLFKTTLPWAITPHDYQFKGNITL